MSPSLKINLRLVVWLLALALLPALRAQTLTINDAAQTYASLTNTTATLTGRAELRITGTGDPLTGCVVHLNSPDAWLRMTSFNPSQVSSTFLSRVLVNGVAANVGTNARVVQYEQGAVVIPQGPSYAPLEVFDRRYFAGTSNMLNAYTAYNGVNTGAVGAKVASFKLKRGYEMTLATVADGTGTSRNYVAQDADLEIGRLPAALEENVKFIRVFPWRWVGKKGIAGNLDGSLDVDWDYNWNLDRSSPANWEYVPIRQSRYWPGLDQDWKARGATHLLGYNEPDQTGQADMLVGDAIYSWPDLLWTGLRLGSPAVSDGGRSSWLYPFMTQANTANLRVDYVAVHYYQCHAPADAAGAASQMYNFLLDTYNNTKKPIWVTEWNNGANWTGCGDPTAAQQAAAIQAMSTMLDNAPFVERYAPYNWVEDVRRLVWDDGSTTAAGAQYRDRKAPLAYRQQRADTGIARTTRYRFDADAHDTGGNGQDAMLMGAPTFTTGKFGSAVVLDGADDYLQIPSNVGNSTDFTFVAWVYWNGGAGWQRIFDLGDLLNAKYLFLSPAVGGAGMRFAITDNGGSGEQRINAPALAIGVWTHVAVTVGGNTGSLFVNGVKVATNTAMTINPDALGVQYNYLGHSRFAADPNFNGRLDDVRFLTTAMTDADIATLAAATTQPTFTTATLTAPNAQAFGPYSSSIASLATGGVGTRTFEKLYGPAWLTVAANGTLGGIPGLADVGPARFTVRVTDTAGGAAVADLNITVSVTSGLPITISTTINGSAQDAEEYANGTMSLTSTDLELVEDVATTPGAQTVGLRFDLNVPQGAVVTNARIQFTADEAQADTTSLVLKTEAADTAAAFTATAGNLASRTRNPLLVQWAPAAWTIGQAGAGQQTPNFAGLVQQVVSRAGWQSGNALAVFITGTGHRTADAFDKVGGAPAVLTVTFLNPPPTYTVSATVNGSANDAEQAAGGAVVITSTDLEMVNDVAPAGNQIVGVRFTGITVPNSAFVQSAHIQFSADEAQSEATNLTLRAEAADAAAIFAATNNNLSLRALTAASVPWAPAAWATLDERGPLQRTPELATLVQEIVNRPGWASGNPLAFIISGTGHRTADSFDKAGGLPATLTLTYRLEIPLGSYERWAAGNEDLAVPSLDLDGDGLVNLAEYALGLDPMLPDVPAPALIADASLLEFIYSRPDKVLDVTYQVEWSESLSAATWSTAGVLQEILSDDGTTRTMRASMPRGGSGKRFVRLKMSRP